jgi:hypothetical protein
MVESETGALFIFLAAGLPPRGRMAGGGGDVGSAVWKGEMFGRQHTWVRRCLGGGIGALGLPPKQSKLVHVPTWVVNDRGYNM